MELEGVSYASMQDVPPETLSRCISECWEALPSGLEASACLLDPCWKYRAGTVRGETPYPTLDHAGLVALKPHIDRIMAKKSIMYLYTTGPKMGEAIALMQDLGYEYKTVFFVLEKRTVRGNTVCCPGYWARSSTEFLLVGARGSGFQAWKRGETVRQELEYVRGRHSTKPTQQVLDRLNAFMAYPGPCIELFSRCAETANRAGWHAHGLEINRFYQAPVSRA